ncbi:alpha/beta hydrolase [Salinibacterium sp. G-O1]|uniref:alpha/beta hydrolase n=1 Tax=Salinibacterium sp. G-O1 TaxID=3046208 RepID=UPI0024BBE647|nr:alpha/beta hydrolase [Salinibacterium sp. G-O1]MDJ0334231.1 alpha/beta hydrolase [Salinibacterium sp. G-O1]
MTRRLLAPGMLAAATLVLSGCSFLAPIVTPPAASEPTDVNGYYSQSLRWDSCGTDLECATAKAPIDWDSPADGSIDLALVKHLATGVAQGSLLVNPGGPGGSGWDYVFYSGEYSATPAVVENFDVVGWDPRGVGQSTQVVCFTDPKQTDETLYGTYDSPYDTQGWIDELATVEQSFAAACEKNTGALLGNVDTASNAKDMDMLRAVLGDDKLNYLGYSYGTYFGTVYAELFPDKVGRFVLDGAVDPLISDFESLKFQMAGFDSAFRAYLADCLSGPDCFFQGTVDDAAAQARSALDNVDAAGFTNADGRMLDSATLATGILFNLYSESSWPSLTAMFTSLAAGDPGPTFQSADYYNSRNEDGTYQSNSFEVYVAATCVDGDFVNDPASTLDRIAEIDAAAPILGKYATYDDFAVLDTACTNWPVPRAALPTSFSADGAAPILVIGTTNDPATPYASAVSLAQQLSSGVLISYQGEGHTVYNQGVACIDTVVDDYFVNGTVPAADPMC